ncbi:MULTISPECIES: nucleotidyltransferase family protein [unclassified Rhodococcus (in: high G+C Gram-positive bacteria)]|uniref:nucleotidyltransferase family protein n=1 Tax=unclassified Rhodococcus (in: high G+C Gram-positive bacteria) TaxID=192944 RepID=UPI0027DFFD8B|nr:MULTISPECIES: nucleotidyltransferase family protein [unclassified Rhodococcus (in: high G+C Gram-positive bacteria)]
MLAQHPSGLDSIVSADLAPLVAENLDAHDFRIPDTLRQARTRAMIDHLTRLRDLRVVSDVLHASGVRWLLFKGPAVGAMLYERPESRLYNDLDILVHPADFSVALAALLDAGVRLVDQNWRMISTKRQGEISLAVGNTVVDLHWHFFASEVARAQIPLRITSPIERRIPIRIGGMTVPTLDPVDTAIFLATHAVLSGGHKIKWFYDIHRAFSFQALDPAELSDRANEYGVALLVAVMVERVAHFIDPTLRGTLDDLQADTAWRHLCRVISPFAPPESYVDGKYTGRAVFSATRLTSASSLNQLRRNTSHVILSRNRRSAVTDRSTLHTAAGTAADKEEWLAYVESHG